MSVRFAGSARLDERRRRHLATQAETELKPRPSANKKSVKKEIIREDSVQNTSVTLFPVKKLISPKKWKLWLISFGLLSLCSLFLYLSHFVQTNPDIWSPDLIAFFSMKDGLLFRGFNSFLVLLSAQLALGIWWARSRSLKDFSGQYRTWFTVMVIGSLISFCMATDAHLVFSNTISWYWNIRFWKQELLGWVVPLLGCATAIVCSMHAEMRRNKLSLTFFWLSMLIWGGRLAFSFDLGEEYLQEDFTLAKITLFNLGSVFLFVSLLFHTQYVVHFDADPPVAQKSLRKRILNRLRLRKSKKKTSEESKEKTTTRTKKATKTKAKPTQEKAKPVSRKTTSAKSTTTAKKTPAKTKTQPATTKRKTTTAQSKNNYSAKKTNANAVKDSSQEKPQSFKMDDYLFEPGEPLDPELLRGLSKKERRQLRKEWKAAQRAA